MIIENGRMWLPPEDASNPTDRKVFHPETSIDNVIVPKEDGTTMKLKEYLGKQVIVSTDDNPPSEYIGQVDAILLDRKEALS